MDKNVIVIVGPTASGKTALAVEIALEIGGEIISADSMQVYKHMNIGTAKPTIEEMKGIKHYLIDEISPDEEFSVAKYNKLAVRYIDEILGKGKIPIVTGGTGLYIKSLTDGLNFTETVCDWDYRKRLNKEAEEKGSIYLHEQLKKVDPQAAEKIHFNDIKRIIRALEVYEYTGIPISTHQNMSISNETDKKYHIFGLNTDRAKLYERINRRVDEMIEKGLVDEVKKLMEMGYGADLVSMQGLGYKEIIWYLKGIVTFEEAVEIIKRDTRRYAKRQMTWFRRDKRIIRINMDDIPNKCEIVKNIKFYIASNGFFL